MKRKFNYTQRVKIRRRDVNLAVVEDAGALRFDGSINLQDYDLPADAFVFLEAYRQTRWMRFSLGRVGEILFPPPHDRRLTEFGAGDHILFRVKVTPASGQHQLLAAAQRIPIAAPDSLGGSESLLPVTPVDLGHELWKLDLSDDHPQLLVNKTAVADWKQLAKSPYFRGLVYPNALRQILTHFLIVLELNDPTADEPSGHWLTFALHLPGVSPLPDSKEQQVDWIDSVVCAFAKKHDLKRLFAEFMTEGAKS